MSRPLAYLISWTTYGSWLPGDERGWVEDGKFAILPGDPERRAEARGKMTEPPVVLDQAQRAIVEETIRAHCRIRNWQLHAVNPRTNHVHVVVTAEVVPETVMDQFKAWCSRRLNEHERKKGSSPAEKKRWWTHHGSTKWINDEEYLQNAIRYVLERQ